MIISLFKFLTFLFYIYFQLIFVLLMGFKKGKKKKETQWDITTL